MIVPPSTTIGAGSVRLGRGRLVRACGNCNNKAQKRAKVSPFVSGTHKNLQANSIDLEMVGETIWKSKQNALRRARRNRAGVYLLVQSVREPRRAECLWRQVKSYLGALRNDQGVVGEQRQVLAQVATVYDE